MSSIDIFNWLGIITGIVCIVACFVNRRNNNCVQVSLGEAVTIFLANAGAFAGIKLGFTIARTKQSALTDLGIDPFYVIIGAIAIIWVSVATVISILRHCIPRPQSQQESVDTG